LKWHWFCILYRKILYHKFLICQFYTGSTSISDKILIWYLLISILQFQNPIWYLVISILPMFLISPMPGLRSWCWIFTLALSSTVAQLIPSNDMNLFTFKAACKHELLFNKPASAVFSGLLLKAFLQGQFDEQELVLK